MTIRGALTRLRTEKRNLVAPALTSCPRAEPSFAMFTVTVTNWGKDMSLEEWVRRKCGKVTEY